MTREEYEKELKDSPYKYLNRDFNTYHNIYKDENGEEITDTSTDVLKMKSDVDEYNRRINAKRFKEEYRRLLAPPSNY